MLSREKVLKQLKNRINAPAWYILLTVLVLALLITHGMVIPAIRLASGITTPPTGNFPNVHIFQKVPPSFYERWTEWDIAGVLICFFMGIVCLVLGIARNKNKLGGRQSYLLAVFLIFFGLNLISATADMQKYINPAVLFYVFWLTFFTYAVFIFSFYFMHLYPAVKKWSWPLLAIPIGYGTAAIIMYFVFGLPFDMPVFKLYTPMMIVIYIIFQLLAFFGVNNKSMVVFFRAILLGWLIWLIYIFIDVRLIGNYFSLANYYKNGMIFFSFFMVCFLVYVNIQEMSNYKSELQKLENELIQNQIAIMLSQIQPHFLYNVLVVIQQLCQIDPKMAEETVIEFSEYLRGNLDSLMLKEPIPFEQELHHVETYFAIEKKRFGDLLNVEYDINKRDFTLPALTLQSIVENAVRYGVTKKEDGGTVHIKTEETDGGIVITVTDNGVGFDTEPPVQEQREPDGRSHVGIENVRSRLAAMCKGTLEIKSKLYEGTVVKITIPGDKK